MSERPMLPRIYSQDGSLTPEQRIRAAVAVLCDGVDQHIVAALFGVNPGRVNEAVQAGRRAFGFSDARSLGLAAIEEAIRGEPEAS